MGLDLLRSLGGSLLLVEQGHQKETNTPHQELCPSPECCLCLGSPQFAENPCVRLWDPTIPLVKKLLSPQDSMEQFELAPWFLWEA